MNRPRLSIAALLALLLLSAGCASTTSMSGAQSGLQVQLNTEVPVDLAAGTPVRLPTTTFGQYHFEIRDADLAVMHGLMPLKFNGGYLTLDILFFAPATFFNLRELFALYEFDPVAGVVRYRTNESDPWMEHTPSEAERSRAESYFRSPPLAD